MFKRYIALIILLVSSYSCIYAMDERDGVYRGPAFGNAEMDFFAGNRPLQIVPSQYGDYRPPASSEPEPLVMMHSRTETPFVGTIQMTRQEEQPARTVTFMHGGHAVRFKDCTISPAREIEQRQSVQLGEACIQNCRVQQSLQRGQCVIDKCDAAWQSAVVDRSKLDSLLSKFGSERQELEAFARGETGATEQEARAVLNHFDQRRHEIEHKLQEAEAQLARHVERYMSSYATKDLGQQVEEQVKLICEERRCAPQLQQAEGERDCKERHKDYWKGCQEEYNRIPVRLLPRFGKWIAQTYAGWRGQDGACPDVIERKIGYYTQEFENAKRKAEISAKALAEVGGELVAAKKHTHQIISSQSAGALNKQFEYLDRCISARGYEISADQSMNRVRRDLLQQNKEDIANELRKRSYSTEHQQVIKEMIQQLEQQREHSPLSMREQARLDAAHKTLQSNGALFVQTYEIIEPTRVLLERAGINPEDMSVFVGDDSQLEIVDEGFKTLDRLAVDAMSLDAEMFLDDMVMTGTHTAAAGMELAREGHRNEAILLNKVADNLAVALEALRDFKAKFDKCVNAAERGAEFGFSDGVFSALHTLSHPVETIKSLGNAVESMASVIAAGDDVRFCIEHLGTNELPQDLAQQVQDQIHSVEIAYQAAQEFLALPIVLVQIHVRLKS